ncbi:MAG: SLC13 family permease [Bacteroidales bacterium]
MLKNSTGDTNVEVQDSSTSPNHDKLIKNSIKFLIAVLAAIAIMIIPSTSFGMTGLTVVEHRVIAIFIFAALMWLLEAVPAWTTSVLVVVLLLLTTSNSCLWFQDKSSSAELFGTLVSYKKYMITFADPIIMLFLGGFVLAIGTTKTGLDVKMARIMLKPFGKKSNYVLLGFILVTAIFSMFISNTATAAMMLAFLAPVLKALPDDGKGKIALVMAIPIGANLGGIGTPIGTPPNAFVLKYLNDPAGLNMGIGFAEWFVHMFPFVILMLFIAWFMLRKFFPFKQKEIILNLKGETKKGKDTWIVGITFIITVILWMLDSLTGVNANVVAMIPIAIFSVTGVLTKDDLAKINWSVLWMVAGGFALGVALEETGLAQLLVTSIPFGNWPVMLVLIGSGLICWTLSTFISNTATAALMVPVIAAVGVGMGSTLGPIGGVKTLLVCIAISASLAMALPISTPPNALAHSTGLVQQKYMEKTGITLGVIGFIIGFTVIIGYSVVGLW